MTIAEQCSVSHVSTRQYSLRYGYGYGIGYGLHDIQQWQRAIHQHNHITNHTGSASRPCQPPLRRTVSPADVQRARRSASGRIVKQRSDVAVEAAREQVADMHVLDGSHFSGSCKTHGTEGSLRHDDGESAKHERQGERQDAKPMVKRILQPCNSVLSQSKQQKTFLQQLQPYKRHVSTDGRSPALVTAPAPCKSILEASVRRVERHKQSSSTSSCSTVSQRAQVQAFSDAYLLALSNGDQQWASAADVAASFAADIILKTQDKQTFYGKPAVLRRLNSGLHICDTKCDLAVSCSLEISTLHLDLTEDKVHPCVLSSREQVHDESLHCHVQCTIYSMQLIEHLGALHCRCGSACKDAWQWHKSSKYAKACHYRS